MTRIVLLLTLAISTSAFGSEKTVEYYYGNQITGSRLDIYADGRVERSERKCCPPKSDAVPMPNLTPVEAALLASSIEAAARGVQEAKIVGTSSMGSSIGSLVVIVGDERVNVRTIEFGVPDQPTRKVIVNQAPEARAIETLVFERVSRPMEQ